MKYDSVVTATFISRPNRFIAHVELENSKKGDIEKILARGKKVLTTMDICGAMSLKTNFENVVTVYVKRDKRALLKSILEKNSTVDDKVNRIISIDDERNNEDICDHVVPNTGYDETAESIIKLLNL